MNRLSRMGILLLFFVPMFGCSFNYTADSKDANELKKDEFTYENSERADEHSEKENTEEIDEDTLEKNSGKNIDGNAPSTPQQDRVSPEEMEQYKKSLKTYIFDEYMSSSDYVYAKGVNWTENFYDNLTAEEVWNVIKEYKEMNDGEEGTLFEQARYLSLNAPIKENWKELFLENWNNSPYAEDNEIETMIDNGDSVGVYTDTKPYTGEKDNYPYITLFKRTGYWHG